MMRRPKIILLALAGLTALIVYVPAANTQPSQQEQAQIASGVVEAVKRNEAR